ncbi:hypothetical protein JTB14_015551 [Gonioctena quinquepunctata]|nr:hypothetical protein JTB14_015551 [Gonioctena quinquepunctata]
MKSQHEIISGLNREIVEIRQNYSSLQRKESNDKLTMAMLEKDILALEGLKKNLLTSIETLSQDNDMNLKEVKKLQNELSNLVENKPDEVDNVETPNSTSEKIPDEETKNRRRKRKQYLKEKSPNPTGKTYSTDFSINIIGPDSIHPSTAEIVTSDQRKTSTDPVTSQDEDDDKLQDSLPKGSPTVMSRILILGDEYAEGFIKVMTPSVGKDEYGAEETLVNGTELSVLK